MKKLTLSGSERAAAYIHSHARPLDRSLFAYHFESGSADNVETELARFQNEDGGFGHGLEPDFRLALSSPMATTVGFQVLREISRPSSNNVVRKGIAYLLATYDPAKRGWPSAPKEINDEPHARWWHYMDDQGDDIAPTGWGNPSAEIVGCLREHTSLVSADFLEEVTDLVLSNISSLSNEIDIHVTLCYLRMADTLPEDSRNLVIEKLNQSVSLSIAGNPDWPGHEPALFWYAPTPDSPLAEVLFATMANRLDEEIERQGEDGSWDPTWHWGQYEEAWQHARLEWKGYLTLYTMLALRAYGRIEGL